MTALLIGAIAAIFLFTVFVALMRKWARSCVTLHGSDTDS